MRYGIRTRKFIVYGCDGIRIMNTDAHHFVTFTLYNLFYLQHLKVHFSKTFVRRAYGRAANNGVVCYPFFSLFCGHASMKYSMLYALAFKVCFCLKLRTVHYCVRRRILFFVPHFCLATFSKQTCFL